MKSGHVQCGMLPIVHSAHSIYAMSSLETMLINTPNFGYGMVYIYFNSIIIVHGSNALLFVFVVRN